MSSSNLLDGDSPWQATRTSTSTSGAVAAASHTVIDVAQASFLTTSSGSEESSTLEVSELSASA
eukprot:CAMPEP_0194540132 /NCGR_PEP_ID=MMETSP0253-20130528/80299_1 /TAXON_ID=2966 /ORGANISM="Noctiluca scintillans" /LENGTH=63 /DNA_ID=CAMNT_0039386475 /DNA_START=164 /DNA_END=355 /DNA_ORIENTATION=+